MKVTLNPLNPKLNPLFWATFFAYKDHVICDLQPLHFKNISELPYDEIIKVWVNDSEDYLNQLNDASLLLFLEFIDNVKQLDKIYPLCKVEANLHTINDVEPDKLDQFIQEIKVSSLYDGFINLTSFYQAIYDLYERGISLA